MSVLGCSCCFTSIHELHDDGTGRSGEGKAGSVRIRSEFNNLQECYIAGILLNTLAVTQQYIGGLVCPNSEERSANSRRIDSLGRYV